jgi:succinoglycan biosynthesis protein ExoV
MKLYYYQDKAGNFGDDLNPYLWYSLAPELFDQDDASILVGIGTLINDRVPVAPRKLVFGSGVGYNSPPLLDDKWQFYCVRGPLSAAQLGLDRSLALTDPAVLITQIVPPQPVVRTGMVSFMAHHASMGNADWKGLCAKAGINFIDPTADIHESVLQIRQSRLLIAEAMHGAIVADAFRVPWVPVACYDHILKFKWDDWCQSLQMAYQPLQISRVWDMENSLTRQQQLKTSMKRRLIDAGVWADKWSKPVPRSNVRDVEEQVVASLVDIALNARSYLSEDRYHLQSINQLLEKLEELKKDIRGQRGTEARTALGYGADPIPFAAVANL